MNDQIRVTILLFDGFTLLDAFGPAELFDHAEGFDVEFASVGAPALVSSGQGVQIRTELSWADCGQDILLVPGGLGTRALVQDREFLAGLAENAPRFAVLASVCTGSALLAAAGLLKGFRATSNKRAFPWATSFGDNVEWQPRARWVHDRERWTSSGVAAGMDMAAAMVAHWQGAAAARAAAHKIELETREDSEDDPFAVESPR